MSYYVKLIALLIFPFAYPKNKWDLFMRMDIVSILENIQILITIKHIVWKFSLFPRLFHFDVYVNCTIQLCKFRCRARPRFHFSELFARRVYFVSFILILFLCSCLVEVLLLAYSYFRYQDSATPQDRFRKDIQGNIVLLFWCPFSYSKCF